VEKNSKLHRERRLRLLQGDEKKKKRNIQALEKRSSNSWQMAGGGVREAGVGAGKNSDGEERSFLPGVGGGNSHGAVFKGKG